MIAFLRGRLLRNEGNRGVLDVRGVGYEVYATRRSLDIWSRAEDPVEIHVTTNVREDAITLFGFSTPVEQKAFEVMLGVSGIGPKLALAALDVFQVDALSQAVESNDVATLSRIPGVGKKTAQRIALELKGKLPAGYPGATVRRAAHLPQPGEDTLVLALARLGYNKTEIDRVTAELPRQGVDAKAPIADRLKAALGILYGNR